MPNATSPSVDELVASLDKLNKLKVNLLAEKQSIQNDLEKLKQWMVTEQVPENIDNYIKVLEEELAHGVASIKLSPEIVDELTRLRA